MIYNYTYTPKLVENNTSIEFSLHGYLNHNYKWANSSQFKMSNLSEFANEPNFV